MSPQIKAETEWPVPKHSIPEPDGLPTARLRPFIQLVANDSFPPVLAIDAARQRSAMGPYADMMRFDGGSTERRSRTVPNYRLSERWRSNP